MNTDYPRVFVHTPLLHKGLILFTQKSSHIRKSSKDARTHTNTHKQPHTHTFLFSCLSLFSLPQCLQLSLTASISLYIASVERQSESRFIFKCKKACSWLLLKGPSLWMTGQGMNVTHHLRPPLLKRKHNPINGYNNSSRERLHKGPFFQTPMPTTHGVSRHCTVELIFRTEASWLTASCCTTFHLQEVNRNPSTSTSLSSWRWT